MRLNQIDVVRETAATNDNRISFFCDFNRMLRGVKFTGYFVRRAPIAAEQINRFARVVDNRVNREMRRKFSDDFGKCFVNGVVF